MTSKMSPAAQHGLVMPPLASTCTTARGNAQSKGSEPRFRPKQPEVRKRSLSNLPQSQDFSCSRLALAQRRRSTTFWLKLDVISRCLSGWTGASYLLAQIGNNRDSAALSCLYSRLINCVALVRSCRITKPNTPLRMQAIISSLTSLRRRELQKLHWKPHLSRELCSMSACGLDPASKEHADHLAAVEVVLHRTARRLGLVMNSHGKS